MRGVVFSFLFFEWDLRELHPEERNKVREGCWERGGGVEEVEAGEDFGNPSFINVKPSSAERRLTHRTAFRPRRLSPMQACFTGMTDQVNTLPIGQLVNRQPIKTVYSVHSPVHLHLASGPFF